MPFSNLNTPLQIYVKFCIQNGSQTHTVNCNTRTRIETNGIQTTYFCDCLCLLSVCYLFKVYLEIQNGLHTKEIESFYWI